MVIESGPFEAIDRKRQQSQKSSVWRKYEEGGSKGGGGGSDLFKHCASIYHTSKNSNQNMCGTETWMWGMLGKLISYNDSWLIDYVLYFKMFSFPVCSGVRASTVASWCAATGGTRRGGRSASSAASASSTGAASSSARSATGRSRSPPATNPAHRHPGSP